MSHYSANPARVRVDLFRSGGKWYATGSINMVAYYSDANLHKAVLLACETSPSDGYDGWPVQSTPRAWLRDGGSIVVLEPYSQYAHPIVLKGDHY